MLKGRIMIIKKIVLNVKSMDVWGVNLRCAVAKNIVIKRWLYYNCFSLI